MSNSAARRYLFGVSKHAEEDFGYDWDDYDDEDDFDDGFDDDWDDDFDDDWDDYERGLACLSFKIATRF